MGEVWHATDTKLGRDVAIKVLPDALAQDADRMARSNPRGAGVGIAGIGSHHGRAALDLSRPKMTWRRAMPCWRRTGVRRRSQAEIFVSPNTPAGKPAASKIACPTRTKTNAARNGCATPIARSSLELGRGPLSLRLWLSR